MSDLLTTIKMQLEERPLPIGDILEGLAVAASKANPSDLAAVELVSNLDDVMDVRLASPALALAPAWGVNGLDVLEKQAFNGPHRVSAMSILGAIAKGRCPTVNDEMHLYQCKKEWLEYDVADDLATEAMKRIRDGMLDRVDDADEKSSLVWAIATLGMFSKVTDEHTSWFEFYTDLLIDSHLVVNRSMLEQFETLLDSGPAKEEVLQKFLTANPVLLDPFVTELRSKHQLGDDFKTDYAVRRINNDYVLVEIENSTDKIFTREGQFTTEMSKASSQVRDFQAWIADNIAYAQRKLPGIRRPYGLVVIGRQKDLDSTDAVRLDEENFSRRGHIRIVTYDDLLKQAKAVHQNLVTRPPVLRAKDQRTI